ncbi:MAG TPA: hypothetical protein VGN54_09075 [Mycobacteriales bacterium]|nr:hypothetical protein [Mycobacteriales bacterium]
MLLPRGLCAGRPAPPDCGLLLVSWAAIAAGIADDHGDYRPFALAAVCVGLVLAFLACAGFVRIPGRFSVPIAALVVGAAPLMAGPANHQHGTWYLLSRVCAYPAAAAILATLRWRRLFGVALGLIIMTALLRILATPTPPIDVHYLLTDSTRGLLQGKDLYRQSWPGSTGLQHQYPYLPWTSVLLLPAWILTHEVRVGLLVASAVATWISHRLAAANGLSGALRTAFVPLLMIGYPLFAYEQQQSWTEPLLLALLAGMLLAVRTGHQRWAIVCLAVALASKQHIVLLLPLAALWPAFGWRRAAASAGLGLCGVLPWLLAGPRDLWDDAVLLNLHYRVLLRGLDVPALALRHGVSLGFAVTAVAVALAYGLAVIRLPRNAAGFAAGGGLIELALDVFNKQSFFNHYTLVLGLFVLALVSMPDRSAAGTGVARQRGMLVDAAG